MCLCYCILHLSLIVSHQLSPLRTHTALSILFIPEKSLMFVCSSAQVCPHLSWDVALLLWCVTWFCTDKSFHS